MLGVVVFEGEEALSPPAAGEAGGCRVGRGMSFKREGDDPSQLNVLKKRRVADLLANYIPEDEALLMRDGRYACTVCSHRPVFDTLDMLTVHRSGKKHVAGLQKFYGNKRSLENELLKRHHQAYVQAEEDGGTQATSGPAPLLVQTRKIAQNALLKAAPYSSCCRQSRTAESHSGPSSSRSDARSRDTSREELLTPRNTGKDGPTGTEATPATRLPGSVGRTADLLQESKEDAPDSKESTSGEAPPSSQPGDLTPEKRRALEHYLRLKSSGWVQDGSGKWVKDENVEFDSDEEDPPPLSPS